LLSKSNEHFKFNLPSNQRPKALALENAKSEKSKKRNVHIEEDDNSLDENNKMSTEAKNAAYIYQQKIKHEMYDSVKKKEKTIRIKQKFRKTIKNIISIGERLNLNINKMMDGSLFPTMAYKHRGLTRRFFALVKQGNTVVVTKML
jgi:hypothetical protein